MVTHWTHTWVVPSSNPGANQLDKGFFSLLPSVLTLIVPSANSVSPIKIAVANRLIQAIHKNCIVYLFL